MVRVKIIKTHNAAFVCLCYAASVLLNDCLAFNIDKARTSFKTKDLAQSPLDLAQSPLGTARGTSPTRTDCARHFPPHAGDSVRIGPDEHIDVSSRCHRPAVVAVGEGSQR